jgi:hypothetical protein
VRRLGGGFLFWEKIMCKFSQKEEARILHLQRVSDGVYDREKCEKIVLAERKEKEKKC